MQATGGYNNSTPRVCLQNPTSSCPAMSGIEENTAWRNACLEKQTQENQQAPGILLSAGLFLWSHIHPHRRSQDLTAGVLAPFTPPERGGGKRSALN